ncbi:hypothetical protein OTU49_007949 [Cherax quadricarinatus]|uniref:Membrane insertase YidC/Oxa/ALB C-terminal domain-containing protein n=2 Tax=Cherax quadricarinatus TaxID=27406 RepID=A0AAW0WSS1_CHEQU
MWHGALHLQIRESCGLPYKWIQKSFHSTNILLKRKLHIEVRPDILYSQKYGMAMKRNMHSFTDSRRKSIFISPFSSCYAYTYLLQKEILSRCNPPHAQNCYYHSFSGNWIFTQRGMEHSFLLTSLQCSPINSVSNRHFSFSWLDSLAVSQAGWFQSLSKSRLVEGLMTSLQGIHDNLHIPWWAAILLSTVLMRGVLTFPIAVYQNYIVSKLENLKPEMDELVKELKKETAYAIRKFGWNEKHARHMFNRSARKIWKELVIRENCHPFKTSILLWVQIPLWIAMTMSFRNMASMMPHQDTAAQVLFLELSVGGFGWIPNLTQVDHSLILPIAMGVLNLIIIEVNDVNRIGEKTKLQKIATNIFRALSVAMIPIAASVPSCVSLYWVISNTCGLAQNLALMHPGLRQLCGIPYSSSQRANPYQHLWQQLQKKVIKKRKE